MTIDTVQAADHEDQASGKGADSVARRQGETLSAYMARMYNLPRRRGRPANLPRAKFQPHTVEGFYAQLRHKLLTYGINLSGLPALSAPAVAPACFKLAGTDYKEWLKHACDSPPPVRYDMPGEPNYCYDCTAAFKLRAQAAGRCRFPNTRFEHTKNLGEMETVGVSRSVPMPITDEEIDFNGMKVPATAIYVRLFEYLRAVGIRRVGPSEWRSIPSAIKIGITGRGTTGAAGVEGEA